MISDFIEDNISEDKAGPMFYALMFYNDVRIQEYEKNAISVLRDNLRWMTDTSSAEKDNEICSQSIFAFMELCMAELMYQGVKDIKKKELKRSADAVSTLKNKKYRRLNSRDKRQAVKWCLWNYEDEVLAMSASVKRIVGGCLSFLAEKSVDGGSTLFKKDIDDMFLDAKSKIYDQGLPSAIGDEDEERFDTEEEQSITLDLISKAMYSDDYVETVIDFCFDS